MPARVYLSIGRPSTPEQEQFRDALTDFLEANGLEPQTAGYNWVDEKQPLQSVKNCLQTCVGSIAVAYERLHINEGSDRRGAPDARALRDTKITTVWNHIEAAMTISVRKPLLVICEAGLREEGVLEDKYEEWRVARVSLDRAAFADREFLAKFNAWKRQVLTTDVGAAQTVAVKPDPSEMSVGQLVAALKPAHLWAVLVALGGLATGVAVLSFQLGQQAAQK